MVTRSGSDSAFILRMTSVGLRLVPYGDINEFFTTDYRARQADALQSAKSPS
jgi:hypothetical protein